MLVISIFDITAQLFIFLMIKLMIKFKKCDLIIIFIMSKRVMREKNFRKIVLSVLTLFVLSIFNTNVFATDANNDLTLVVPSTNPAPITQGGNQLGTLFGANNGGGPGGGIYFELENVGTEAIVIDDWDINTDDQTSVNVWTRVGTYSGFEQSSAGWTLLGNDNAVVAQGADQPTPVAVGGLVIQPGEIYGIAMEGDGSWNYTNGDGTNEVYNNGVLELRAGSANNLAFNSGLFTPRVWNGVVRYSNAGPPAIIPSLGMWSLILLTIIVLTIAFGRFTKQN